MSYHIVMLSFAALLFVFVQGQITPPPSCVPGLPCVLEFVPSSIPRILSLGDGSLVRIAGGRGNISHTYNVSLGGQYMELKFYPVNFTIGNQVNPSYFPVLGSDSILLFNGEISSVWLLLIFPPLPYVCLFFSWPSVIWITSSLLLS